MALLKLYYFPASPASNGALFTARNLKIADLEIKIVNLPAREQHEDWYKKINPQSTVPALDDNGFIVAESRAISQYLVNSRAPGSTLYPTEPKARALVDSRLYYDATTLFPAGVAIVKSVIYGGATSISDEIKEGLLNALRLLNQFLTKNKWVAGPNVTIADLHICASVANFVACKAPMDDFHEVKRWYEACKTLPGFVDIERGASGMGALILGKIGSEGLSA